MNLAVQPKIRFLDTKFGKLIYLFLHLGHCLFGTGNNLQPWLQFIQGFAVGVGVVCPMVLGHVAEGGDFSQVNEVGFTTQTLGLIFVAELTGLVVDDLEWFTFAVFAGDPFKNNHS